MARFDTSQALGPITLADRAILGPVTAVAAVIAGSAAVGILTSVFQIMRASELTVTDMPLGNPSTPEFTEQLAQITSAQYESVAISLADPPADVRWLLWGESAAGAMIAVAVCAVLAWLCIRTIQRRPFARGVTIGIGVVSVVVLVFGVAQDLLHDMTRTAVVRTLGPDSTGGGQATFGIDEGFVSGFDTDLATVGWAFALAALAVVFHLGSRMQHDTERLV